MKLSERCSVGTVIPVFWRESTEDEMRKAGIRRPNGHVYCKVCGYHYGNWEEFFRHHKAKHPWEDPEVWKAIMADGEKYIEYVRELLGLNARHCRDKHADTRMPVLNPANIISYHESFSGLVFFNKPLQPLL